MKTTSIQSEHHSPVTQIKTEPTYAVIEDEYDIRYSEEDYDDGYGYYDSLNEETSSDDILEEVQAQGDCMYYMGGRGRPFRRSFYSRRPSGRFNQGTRFRARGSRGSYFNSPNVGDTRCRICDSRLHYANDCQHKQSQPSTTMLVANGEEANVTLAASELVLLLADNKIRGILDTGASTTVAGKFWIEEYVKTLTLEQRANVTVENNAKTFRFGDGALITSNEKYHIPIFLCNQPFLLGVYVIPNAIPLLISGTSMSNVGIILDCKAAIMKINGQQQSIIKSESKPLFTVDLTQMSSDHVQDTFHVDEMDTIKKQAIHLHRYFAHHSSEKIGEALENSNVEGAQKIKVALKEIEKSCDHCRTQGRSAPRRKVALPIGKKFNDVVSIDIKFIGKVPVLHCIDRVTRYSAATVMANKSKEEIIKGLFRVWISVFGVMGAILTDNGGEFLNFAFTNLCDTFGIIHLNTAAYAPWQNGTVERHNAVIGEAICKIMGDVGCNIEVATQWSCQAKNSLNNVFGFSPYQLVFGRNPRLPNIFNTNEDHMPYLDSENSQVLVAEHLKTLYSARKAYCEAENSSRLKRALKERIYTESTSRYLPGDKVYYKREKTWYGPATVIHQQGQQVLLKSGGLFIKCDPTVLRLQMYQRTDEKVEVQRNLECPDNILKETVEDPSKEEEFQYEEVPAATEDTAEDWSKEEEFQYEEVPVVTEDTVEDRLTSNDIQPIEEVCVPTEKSVPTCSTPIIAKRGEVTNHMLSQILKDKEDDKSNRVENEVPEDSLDTSTRLLFIEEEDQRLDDTSSHAEINEDKLLNAKKKEVSKWKKFDAYEEVATPNQVLISTRWVVEEYAGDYKVRLCVRGYEESEMYKHTTEAPTVNKVSLRIFFMITAAKGWVMECLDIRSAFLQSKDLEHDVFIQPPKEFRKPGIVWKLKKPVYGLNYASFRWYETVKNELTTLGCAISPLDKAVFLFYENECLTGIVVVHVDDFVFSGNSRFIKTVMKIILNKFVISRRSKGIFMYLGWEVKQDVNGITVNQQPYYRSLQKITCPENIKEILDTELEPSMNTQYRGLIGKVSWLNQTRPDLRYDVMKCSMVCNTAKWKDVIDLNSILEKMDQGPRWLHFPRMANMNRLS